jgi:hypothetical protein
MRRPGVKANENQMPHERHFARQTRLAPGGECASTVFLAMRYDGFSNIGNEPARLSTRGRLPELSRLIAKVAKWLSHPSFSFKRGICFGR